MTETVYITPTYSSGTQWTCKGTNYNRDIYLVFFYLDGTNETSNGITTTAAYKIYYFNTTTSDKYLSYFQTWSKSDPNNNVAVISCINRSVIAVNKPYYYYYWEALNRLFPGQYYISVVAKDSTNATASSTSPTFYIVQNISDYYKLRPNMTGFDTPAPYHTFTARDIGSNYVWHLFDGQYLSDAWQPQVSNPPTSSVPDWAVFDLGTGNFNKLSRYTFYIMNDTNHRPMDWTVWGSNDNFTTSTLLDTRSSYTFNDLLGNFNIPTTDSTYRYYKWNFTSASGGVALVLDQIDMYFNESYSITNVNCTSCNIPYGSTTPPYTTDDTTPTFTFNTTNVQLACRISDRNWNYTTMGSSRDCDYGQYRTTHTCTLTTQDGLVNYNTSVYIICFGGVDSNNASIQLPMLITSLETPSSLEAIEQGIENSVIWPGATVYTNQKVYLRSINNSQKMTTVNKVAVYGNQRWLFNYVNENGTTLGLFNITPIVYVLDMKNMSTYAIRANVTAFIASTKN